MARATFTSSGSSYNTDSNVPLNITNTDNRYLKFQMVFDAVVLWSRNLGQVTGVQTFTPSAPELDAMFAATPNNAQGACIFRLQSFTDAGYTTQDGADYDVTKTLGYLIGPEATRPLFPYHPDVVIENEDADIEVRDSYDNLLRTTSTQDLLGTVTEAFIKNHGQAKATVPVADRATSREYATMIEYYLSGRKFGGGAEYTLTPWSDVSDVEAVADVYDMNDFYFYGRDSRSWSSVPGAGQDYLHADLFVEYDPLALASSSMTRDNFVDAATVLDISGTFWEKYFASNTTSDPSTGEFNEVTGHYRYKETDHDWAANDATFTITIASPGRVTDTAHGLETGDQVYLSTTGALPTGLAVDTAYYVIEDDVDHFWLATSYANAIAGTKINTSGTQSGTHTAHRDSIWLPITLTTDAAGNFSFSDYVDGDLGSGGFNMNKSYDVEVRVYDFLSAEILAADLPVGTPLIDYYHVGDVQGMAINGKYDPDLGGSLQINGETTKGGGMPEGAIIPWIGGYFTDADNASYTRVLGTANTVAAVNALMNEMWRVCNGAELDDDKSTIFNGSGRHLPDLTDGRFIRGSTTAGGIGGSDTVDVRFDHNHTLSDNGGAKVFFSANPSPSAKMRRVSGFSAWTATHNVAASGGNDTQANNTNGAGLTGVTDAHNGAANYTKTITPVYLNVLYLMRVRP